MASISIVILIFWYMTCTIALFRQKMYLDIVVNYCLTYIFELAWHDIDIFMKFLSLLRLFIRFTVCHWLMMDQN
ncbi:hypothetical protein EDC96DRAFT_518632 [Choanephora cucurbitarum]|nr:hypothetical protein EDC96DRAFT_518632 [Choanephora cucurbitarum]